MKLLTLNFLTCARKTCKSAPAAFPLHPKDAELEQVELELNPLFLRNILPRLEWEAIRTLTQEVSFTVWEFSRVFGSGDSWSRKGDSAVDFVQAQPCPYMPKLSASGA